MKIRSPFAGLLLGLLGHLASYGNDGFVNSVGQTMVSIPSGTFIMGSRNGDRDEEPLHKVTISAPLFLSSTEVTNRQFEIFSPAHKTLRGKLGFSKSDDEAVVFVSWEDAVAFCAWLSERENKTYRLPTEAEWEYAARAGTTTDFNTGNEFPSAQHNNQVKSWYPDPARSSGELERVKPLKVGQYPANAWGLYDMHGNVEEWVSDWYGPYESGEQMDPGGRVSGEFRVTRGGSHSVELRYLRSANRAGTIPQDKSWLIGFRVAAGAAILRYLPPVPPELYQQAVRASRTEVSSDAGANAAEYFKGPRPYVKVQPTERGPFFTHNHVPSLTETPNGDLLAVWYSTPKETDRDLHYVASRLKSGAKEWEPASESFFTPPDRNAHAAIVWWDSAKTIWHINGIGVAATWGAPALIARTSQDNGVSWTAPRLLNAEHGPRRMVVASMIRTQSGALIFSADVPGKTKPAGNGGSTIWVSTDDGASFNDAGQGSPDPDFAPGKIGGWIAGIHAPIAETADRKGILAFGRRDGVPTNLLRSVSYDLGKTWKYDLSAVQPLGSGQRCTILRLQDGSLFLASFGKDLELPDATGVLRKTNGLYAALSFDDGVTWAYRRLVTPGGLPQKQNGGAWTGEFELSDTTAEPKGYLASTQAKNGTIHLISSALHYEFNAAWIRSGRTPPSARN